MIIIRLDDSSDIINPNIDAANAFLIKSFTGKYYGPGLSRIDISLIPTTKNKKERARLLYGKYVDVFLPVDELSDDLSIKDLRILMAKIDIAVTLASKVTLTNSEFDFEAFLTDWNRIKGLAPKTKRKLELTLASSKPIRLESITSEKYAEERYREQHPRILRSKLRGIRIMAADKGADHGTSPRTNLGDLLFPMSGAISEVVGGLLASTGLLTPRYTEIYVVLSSRLDWAILESPLEEWYETTAAEIDVRALQKAPTEKQLDLIIEATVAALKRIVKADHLDKASFQKVFKLVEKNGIDIDIPYKTKVSDTHEAVITYNITHSNENGLTPFVIRVTELRTGNSGATIVDWLEYPRAGYSIGTVILNKSSISIKGRDSWIPKSFRRKYKLPHKYNFILDDVLNGPELEILNSSRMTIFGDPPKRNTKR